MTNQNKQSLGLTIQELEQNPNNPFDLHNYGTNAYSENGT